MDTCRLPDCDEPILNWLDREYCSVDHRTRATRRNLTITVNVDTGSLVRSFAGLAAGFTPKGKP